MGGLDWDRHHDWVLLRSVTRSDLVAFQFDASMPKSDWLRRIRRATPELRNVPPNQLLERVSASGRLDLGRRSVAEAAELAASAERAGVRLERRAIEEVSYLPMDRTAGTAMLVEYEPEATRIVQQMLAAGVPVEDLPGTNPTIGA